MPPFIGVIEELSAPNTYEWRIPNFTSLNLVAPNYYMSPPLDYDDYFWQFRIERREGSDCLTLIFRNIPRNFLPHVSCTVSIKKDNGTLFVTHSTASVGENTIFPDFINIPFLLQRESEFLPAGTLTFSCVLTTLICSKKRGYFEEENQSNKRQAVEDLKSKELADLETLSDNLEGLFANKESCDTTLNVQDKEYKAHRAILIARSPVFAAMFLHETSEKQTGIVTIPDCNPESFEKFLHFLYCGKIKIPSLCSAIQLYGISDKYEVMKLKPLCLEYLLSNLTVENICDVVVFAEKYNEEKLLNSTQRFFNKNLHKILQTSEWDLLVKENYSLSKRLLIEMARINAEIR